MNDEPVNYDKPVAYDADGQPLYAHPVADEETDVTSQPVVPPTIVHLTRPLEPLKQEISPELQEKHDKSVRRYPQLDLSEHEFVILLVRRNMIGMLAPVIMSVIFISLVVAGAILYPQVSSSMRLPTSIDYNIILLIGVLLCVGIATGLYILYWVYVNNLFFLTNESIIEKTQLSLFSSNVKSVGLGDVVEVSYRQTGIIQEIFNYGVVQVGTKDDEVPYIFSYVHAPKEAASSLKDAVEAFKNGRPVGK